MNENENKLRKILSSIRDKISSFFNTLKNIKLSFFLVIILLGMSSFTTYFIVGEDPIINENKMYSDSSELKKLQILRSSYNKYINEITKQQIQKRWIDMFSTSRYKNNGCAKYDQYDCISGVMHFMWSYGANCVMENVQSIDKRADKLSALKLLNIRKSYYKVKPKDIIIFTPIKGINHVGIVYDISNGWIRTMEISARTMGCDFNAYKWGSNRIKKIFEPSFSFWAGNAIKELDK